MKKYICIALAFTALLFQGCDKKSDNFVRLGIGEIRYDGQVHRLYNAKKWALTMGQFDAEGVIFHRTYDMNIIELAGVDSRNTFARLTIRTEQDRFESGMFHMFFGISNEPSNSIDLDIHLSDDYVHRLRGSPTSSTRVFLFVKEEDDVFEIRLINEAFSVKYRGLIEVTSFRID